MWSAAFKYLRLSAIKTNFSNFLLIKPCAFTKKRLTEMFYPPLKQETAMMALPKASTPLR